MPVYCNQAQLRHSAYSGEHQQSCRDGASADFVIQVGR